MQNMIIMQHIRKLILAIIGLLYWGSVVNAQTAIDIEKEKPVIESRDKEFSKYIFEGDSIALANMYTKDAQFGTLKGAEIPTALGKWIRNAIKNDSRNVTFKMVTLNADGELLIETGTGEVRSDAGQLKSTFHYLVVWKKEDGTWKLYRDIGL
jgi:ketosteroid isomerase-like protein